MDLRDVAANIVHDYPGGAASLAPRIGKNATTLAHEVHGTGSAKLGLLDAEKITLRTGDMRILEAYALNCGYLLVALPVAGVDATPDDCMAHLTHAVREFGDVCAVMSSELGTGSISDNKLALIDRECGELIAAVRALRTAVASRNLSINPVYSGAEQ